MYGQKGFLSYLDLFSSPFDDLDFSSVPLGETTPPTYDENNGFAGITQVTFDPDSSASVNLEALLKQIISKSQSGAQTVGCKGVVVIFDTLNSVFDSLGATPLNVLEFTNSMRKVCQSISQLKVKEETKQQTHQTDEDDYYDDDDDDIAAIRARRGLQPQTNQKSDEISNVLGV